MKKYALMAVAIVMIVTLVIAGCGRKGPSGVAEINGESISYEDFAKQMGQSPGAAQVLSQMLEDRMMLGLAKEKDVEPTDEQVNQQIEMLRKTRDLDNQLKQAEIPLDDVKSQLKVQQARINLAEKIAKDEVSEEDVKVQYEQNKEFLYELPERMRVQLVIFKTKAAADKAAKEIAGGSTLEKVAAEQTDEHSKARTELIPKTGRGIPPEIAKAAFDTPKGKATKPLKLSNPMLPGQDSYVIMQPVEKLAPLTISEKEAAPIIRGQLSLQKAMAGKEYDKMINDAKKKAKITVNIPQLKQVEKDFEKPPQPSMGMPMTPPQRVPGR